MKNTHFFPEIINNTKNQIANLKKLVICSILS